MKTLTVTTYSFDELPLEAQERAIQDYKNQEWFDGWAGERSASRKEAKKIYDSLRDMELPVKGARLYTYIINNFSHLWTDKNGLCKDESGKIVNDYWRYKRAKGPVRISKIFVTNNLENCPFTGVCYDMDFMQPIIDFLKNPDKNISSDDLSRECPEYQEIQDRDYWADMEDSQVRETLENMSEEYFQDGSVSTL